RTAQRELDDAYTLVTRFPRTVEVWEAGRISRGHAAIILKTGLTLPDEVRAAWEETVLEFAVKETPGRTDAYARELAEIINPVSMAERHAEAVTKRSISVVDLADGMALLEVLLPATIAYAIRDRIRQQAKIVRDTANADRARRRKEATQAARVEPQAAAGSTERGGTPADEPATATALVDATVTADVPVVDDVRTTAQISADLVADMLLCATPTIDPTGNAALDRVVGHVQITIPATALTGMTESGAMLNGRIPVDPGTARRLAGNTPGWDRVFTHPITGIVTAVDRYTPAASQTRYLRARDKRCRGYGCRQPVHRCQIDHNHEHHNGGPTTNSNLAHLCTRHHTLKTETPWTATQHPNGTLEFRSPLGHTYTDQPPPHVTFIPDNQPPPF
ncbi:DUF222 domain-containing protein, partial [Microbacterium sp. RD1]|uniref:HNH endonuclease signature motif containing protein n=1 Tax=Microbacterium sp. RD1 TaxID=3457313 RepID=UPI003FA53D6B